MSLADIDPTGVAIAMAIATLTLPVVLIAVAAVAWRRRDRGAGISPRFEAILAFLVGACLGTFELWSGSTLVAAAPLLVVLVVMTVTSLRRGRWVLAGWLIAGSAMPWTVLWFVYVLALAAGAPFDPAPTWAGFLAGLTLVIVGLFVVSRGDRGRPAPDPIRPGESGPRSLRAIAQAISEPSRIGPFRANDLAAVVALVVTWAVVGFLPTPNRIINLGLEVVLGAVVATEAYILAMPSPMRRAWEAFSWLGEWEFAQVRQATKRAVPTTRAAAEAWLAAEPDRPELLWIRAEVLVMANRLDEAAAAVARMPTDTVEERFQRAAAFEMVDWMAGGDGNLPALEAAVADLGPIASDDRLRGEVALAAAKVRHLTIEGPATTATIQPFLDVRKLLGRRADGQVGRVLRKRLLPAFLVFGIVFGALLELTSGGSLVP